MMNLLLQQEKQNYSYWVPWHPEYFNQHPRHSQELTVWCGAASSGAIGPYFFATSEDAAGTVSAVWKCCVTSVKQSTLRNWCAFGKVSESWGNFHYSIIKQSAGSISPAPYFPGRRCSMACTFTLDAPLSAFSSSLSTCVYFLLAHLKSKVFLSA
jgi:hypothetical protein